MADERVRHPRRQALAPGASAPHGDGRPSGPRRCRRRCRRRAAPRWIVLLALAVFGASTGTASAQTAFRLGGSQVDDGRAIAVDAQGHTHLVGRFRQTVDFDPGPGLYELTPAVGYATYVASYTAAGALRYAFALDGASAVAERGIAVDDDGNVFVTGQFSGTIDFDPSGATELLNSVDGRIFVASYDSTGGFRFAFNMGVSGIVIELGSSIALDAAGNCYVTGEFAGETDFDPTGAEFLLTSNGVSDVFVASYGTNGGFRFAVAAGGTQRDRGLAIAVDAAGNSFVTGAFGGSVDFDPGPGSATLVSNGADDVFLASYDGSGALRYALGAGSALTDIGRGVAVDAAGHAFITGEFADQADFDPGVGVWTLTSGGGQDLFLASYDGAGDLRFAFGLGNSNAVVGHAAAIDASGGVHVTGSFRNAVDFDPGPGDATLVTSSTAAFVASYSNTGAFVDAYHFEATSGSSSEGHGIAIDPAGRANVIGSFSGTIDFDPGAGEVSITSNGSDDVFFSSLAPAASVPALGAAGVLVLSGLLGALGARRLHG